MPEEAGDRHGEEASDHHAKEAENSGEAVRLTYACFHLGDQKNALAALNLIDAPAGSPAANQLERFRKQLQNAIEHARRAQGRRP